MVKVSQERGQKGKRPRNRGYRHKGRGRNSLWLDCRARGRSGRSCAGRAVEFELDAEGFRGPVRGLGVEEGQDCLLERSLWRRCGEWRMYRRRQDWVG